MGCESPRPNRPFLAATRRYDCGGWLAMSPRAPSPLEKALFTLKQHGLLLAADSTLPSVATLVAGEPISGSWWGHRLSGDIYQLMKEMDNHPDVAQVRLVSRKVTYLYRSLWPTLLAVASSREPWQTDGLSSMAKQLLDAVLESGELRTDHVPRVGGPKPGDAARDLERRLLVYGEQVHTDTWAHAKLLQSWERWADRVGASAGALASEEGKLMLERGVAELNARFGGKGTLPWM